MVFVVLWRRRMDANAEAETAAKSGMNLVVNDVCVYPIFLFVAEHIVLLLLLAVVVVCVVV